MRECDVRSLEQALACITDCTLATVQSMAMLKSRKNDEFDCQISIAQKAVDWVVDMGVNLKTTRAEQVVITGESVRDWVAPYINN
jgi:hypothetical protein